MDRINLEKVVVIIPAHNEEKTIKKVIQGIKQYIRNVIVVDDGSEDNTARLSEDERVMVIRHIINKGVGGAQKTAYRLAFEEGFDYIIQIDADGQHDPKYIPLLLEKIKENYDMVIGSRFLNQSYKDYQKGRQWGIRFFSWLVNLFGKIKVTDVTSGYRIYRTKKLFDLTESFNQHWAVEQTLEAARRGWKIAEISIEMPVRKHGQSQFNLKTYFLYPFRMFEVILRVLLFRR